MLLKPWVTRDDATHTYFDPSGRQYTSVSRILDRYKVPFENAEAKAMGTARKRDRETKALADKLKISQEEVLKTLPKYERGITQNEVLREWSEKNKSSIEIGHKIHKVMETGEGEPRLVKVRNEIIKLFSDHKETYDEVIFYSEKYGIAGTADKPCVRNRKKMVLDIFDYKTNESKGIQYSSKYENWKLPPLTHLEDCNYIDYALQLSLYGLMAEEHGWKVGMLKLIFIPPNNPEGFFQIPMPYLRKEAIEMAEANKKNPQPKKEEETIIHSWD